MSKRKAEALDSSSSGSASPEEDSSSEDDAPLSQRPVQADAGSSDSEEEWSGGVEASATDNEQDEKEVVPLPYQPGEQPAADKNELKAIELQDLKTEDARQPGGYARRLVRPGDVVLVRGANDDGTTVTWVALVNKIWRQPSKPRKLRVGICWFYRAADVPPKAAKKGELSRDPRRLIITNDAHEVDARFIRHPATAWFLAPLAPLPTMRCGAGEARHSRLRPGFIVTQAYDAAAQRLYAIGDPQLAKRSPELAKQVQRLVGCSTRELERLQREEAAFDAAEGLEGVDAVFLPPEDQAAAEAPPSSDSEPESESDSDEDEETAALRRQAEAERQRQRAAAEAAKQRRREREALDAAAARLAQLLPQQGQPPQSPAAAGQQQQPQRQGSSPASPEAAPQTWQRCALQVLRQAGGLPKQQSAPQTKQQQQQGKQGIARLEQKQVEELMRTCRVPSTQPLMAVLRAIAGATEEAADALLGETNEGKCGFVRALVAWLFHLVVLLAGEGDVSDAVGATVATLRALARSPYTGRMHNWVAMVHGDQLIRKLAVNQLGLYPPAVQQAASELKAAWFQGFADLQARQRQEKQARKERQRAEVARDAQQQRADVALLQQSPQAAKARSLATGGRHVSALGAGGAVYVRPRQSPQPPGMGARAASPAAAALTASRSAPLAQAGGAAGAVRRLPQQPQAAQRPQQPANPQPPKPPAQQLPKLKADAFSERWKDAFGSSPLPSPRSPRQPVAAPPAAQQQQQQQPQKQQPQQQQPKQQAQPAAQQQQQNHQAPAKPLQSFHTMPPLGAAAMQKAAAEANAAPLARSLSAPARQAPPARAAAAAGKQASKEPHAHKGPSKLKQLLKKSNKKSKYD